MTALVEAVPDDEPETARTEAQRYEKRLREVWGANIAAARKRKKWSQAELARRTAGQHGDDDPGVHQTSIAKYEKARAKPLEAHKVSIARALGRNPVTLFPLELPPDVEAALAGPG